MSDEELLKPDLPVEGEALSDEELLKPDLPIGYNEMAGLNYEAATGADAPESGLMRHLVNINSIGARGFAAGQMSAAQSLSDGSDRDDAATDSALSRMLYGTTLGTVASWFSTPDVLEDWDRSVGRKFIDAADRTKARNAYAAEIARQFIKDRVQTQQDAGTELQTREAKFGAQALGDLEQNLGYMVPFALGPLGIAAQFAASASGEAQEFANDQYALDEDGNLVLTAKGDSVGKAIVKGLARAGIETGVELVGGKLVGAGLKKAGGALAKFAVGKFPIFKETAGKIGATAVGKAAAKATTSLNRLTGWTSRKLHLEGLGEEYIEEWLDPTLAETLGVARRDSEQSANPLSRLWGAQKEFFTPENQGRLVTSLILLQGAGGFVQWCAQAPERRVKRIIDPFVVGHGLMTAEEAATATPEAKAETINEYVQRMDEREITGTFRKVATWAEKMGASLKEEAAKSGARAPGTEQDGTPGTEQGVAAGDGTAAAEAAGAAQDGTAAPRTQDEIAREEERAARAQKVHDLRGKESNPAEQVKGIEELGVTSWAQAEADGLTERDRYGRFVGGARRALNIAIHGTAKLKEAVKEGRVGGELAEELLTAAQCELGARPKAEQDALIDGILERAQGDEALARRMVERLAEAEPVARATGSEKGAAAGDGTAAEEADGAALADELDRIAAEVKTESIRERNPNLSEEDARAVANEIVETEDGRLVTLGETVRAEPKGAAGDGRFALKPQTAYEGAVNAERLKGTKLRVMDNGLLGCTTFPNLRVQVSSEGVVVEGLTADDLAKPENAADAAAVLVQLDRIASRNGIDLLFADETAKPIVDALAREIDEQGLARAQAKLDTRAKLFGLLFKTTLGNGVTYDETSFRAALEKTPNGRPFVDRHGDIYGFVDGEGVLHFNPAAINFNTPIREYGHLALEAIRGINPALWRRGMELVRNSEYFREIKGYSEVEGHEYAYLKGRDEGICDEALATLIGDRGARLVEGKGLAAELKAWLKEVWKAFRGAFGLADLTEEQIEKMTLGEFVDTINAELLKGSEFGTRKRAPLSKTSIRKYDEDGGSGSNGLLRWKNDRGYLFALPVDLERTQLGGKVVLARDDANVTDWIERRLAGLELRLSKNGKVYVRGQNGFEGELADIFGRYPTVGRNDGLAAQIAQETGHAEWAEAAPEELVAGLAKDRAGFGEWAKARAAGTGQDALAAREEAAWRAEAEGEAERRWQDSGMGVVEYIRDMAERGEPGFDLDWETARAIENDRAQALMKNLEEIGLMHAGAGAAARAAATGQGAGGVNPNLERDVREAISGDAKGNPIGRRKEVSFSDMPATLKAVGIPDLPIRTRTDIVRKLKREHKFTEQQIAALPTAYGQPAAVFADGKAFVVLTEMRIATRKGTEKPVMVVLRENVDRNGRHEFLASAYPREESNENFYQGLARNGGMLFLDKNKVAVIGLSGRTISTLNKQADGNRVKTPEDLSSLVSRDSIANRVAEFNGGGADARFSVGRLYTGSAADYERPSLNAVGTGEGSQVYGWGLYASNRRGVAESYANAGVPRGRNLPFMRVVSDNGTTRNGRGITPNNVKKEAYADKNEYWSDMIAASTDNPVDARKRAQKYGGEVEKYFNAHFDEYKFKYDNAPGAHVYEQTWFTDRAPGDESHLLNWYEPVGVRERRLAYALLAESGAKKRTLIGGGWTAHVGGRQVLGESQLDLMSQGAFYDFTADVLGSPRAASEWLAAHGIDGVKYPVDSYGGKTVKDGDEAGWNYVSFRDDNIRVDHKWRDGEAVFHVGRVNPKLREDVARLTNTDRTKGEIVRRNEIVEFSDTPDVLRLVGMPEARIVSRADILRKIKARHFLSDEAISELPDAYAAPAAVFRDGKNFVVLTDREAKTQAGVEKPVMVYLKESNDKGVDNFLASAYAREPSKEKVYSDLAKAGNLLYFDKGKAARLNLEGETLSQLTPQGLSGLVKTPEDLSSLVSRDSIANRGEERNGGGAGAAVRAAGTGQGTKFSVGGDRPLIDLSRWRFGTGRITVAMGDTEQGAAGLAAGIERRGALRPWTKKASPADRAKPIAFDAADMVELWRAVSGSLRNPHVQKGDRIKGHRNAVGLNVGGDKIEIVSKVFGVVDEGDIEKLRADCRADGFFRDDDVAWRAKQTRLAIDQEATRSAAELDRRITELYRHRVETGEGGEHYATQVLGHEIGHTLANLPRNRNLGPVGNAMRTLFDAMERELAKRRSPLHPKDYQTFEEESRALIAWWHGQETMPKYYEKPSERFAEIFGIFLTQPESVQRKAPKTYDLCLKLIAENETLCHAYRKVVGLKWSGQSNDAFVKRLRATWDRTEQQKYRKLKEQARNPVSSAWDTFIYACVDQFGPMFNISERGLAAERKLLKKAVREGRMSQAEADDRLNAKQSEINALKTSLYNWQRQSGGQTRLMIEGFDEVMRHAEKQGVDWEDVKLYAHLSRVIELGGRATAHGGDPARAASVLEDLKGRLGPEGYANVERTWNEFRAVYERCVLSDPNVRELFDDPTNKALWEKKHYITMTHRMGAEERADWDVKLADDGSAVDAAFDLMQRLHRRIGSNGDGEQGFVLHRLTGSFEATEEPLSATILTAIKLKEAAARNHLVKQLSETLRACGAKGVYDFAGSTRHGVDSKVYGRIGYMDKGVRHELIVPRVVYRSFREHGLGFGWFGVAMRFVRNTMTLWNPAFVNRAYLIDKGSLETNIKGLHKPLVDVISEAMCFRGIGVPLYLVNNYLARFTPIAQTGIGKLLWDENTVNHYAYRATKIARIVYEGKFNERLEEAQRLRKLGKTAEAAEIEENVAIAREMLRRNVFQSKYEFNREQGGFSADEILTAYGYRLEGESPKTWRGRAWSKTKAGGRAWNRFQEEQEACTKIIAYLYQMKVDAEAGRTSEADAEARARLVIDQGGTPNLAARGVLASYIENATGFFWNVRREGSARTLRAIKDHPEEWLLKNLAQTALPAILKGLMITGGLEWLIRKFFDDDDEKIAQSWWAPAVLEHARWTNEALKCVPGYYQRNYNVIPLAKFGDEVVSLRVKYAPEEFAIQGLVHTTFQKLGQDPTDPSADWSTLARGVWDEFMPDLFGHNYLADTLGAVVGPLLGVNPYDSYRQRNMTTR